jgi:hypothetical protein
MRALTDVLPGLDRAQPVLLLDQRPKLAGRSGPTEGVDFFGAWAGETFMQHLHKSLPGSRPIAGLRQ